MSLLEPRRIRSSAVLITLVVAVAACSSGRSDSDVRSPPSATGGVDEAADDVATGNDDSPVTEPPETDPPVTDPTPTESPLDSPPVTDAPDEVDPSVAAVADLPGAQVATVDPAGTDPAAPLPDEVVRPIVFVHGFAGSAQQYESQAMRFVANGYPAEQIVAYDHDGAGLDIESYADGVDGLIDQVLADTGAEQIYLVGHSRGTIVSTRYLEDPVRAAKVAKYVAVDGVPCPDGIVPCVAPNQANNPGQAHVEVATSEESFAMQYEFLVGEAPEVLEIVPQRAPVVISGRAVNFPANTGRQGATLEIWPIDRASGTRLGGTPHASFPIGADGEFGPLVLESGAHYEYS